MSKAIGLRIAAKRAAKSLSQTDLAGKVKVSPGQILKVEKGHANLSPELAKRLERTLGLKFSKAELGKQKAPAAKKQSPKKKSKAVSGKPTWNTGAKATVEMPAQGVLPGFSEMVAPKAAEMAREIVFQALRKAISEEMEKVVTKLKVV